jgi:hypothetical protein
LPPQAETLKEGGLPTSAGVSFLEVKYQLLLSYVSHIMLYVMLKLEGKPVSRHPVMDRLHHIRCVVSPPPAPHPPLRAACAAEAHQARWAWLGCALSRPLSPPRDSHTSQPHRCAISLLPVLPPLPAPRTLLERVKPVDAKLKFQLNKLLQSAAAVGGEGGGGGVAKPRPDALVSHAADAAPVQGKKDKKKAGKGRAGDHAGEEDGEADGDLDAGEGDLEAQGVYRPLKRSAVMFDDKRGASKAEREAARARARTSKSLLFKDILEECVRGWLPSAP